jgi:hypothetical protein
MIVVREVFHLHFGKAHEAIPILQEMRRMQQARGAAPQRIPADYVGPYYTVVFESTHEDLAAYERDLANEGDADDSSDLFERFVPLVRHGRREIFRLVE